MIEKGREELRRRLATIQDRKPPSRRYPEDVREAVRSFVRGRLAAGKRCKEICQELSLPMVTVIRWMQKRPNQVPALLQAERFRTVAVVKENFRSDSEQTFGSVSLISPGGYRVEGLRVEQVLYLLRGVR